MLTRLCERRDSELYRRDDARRSHGALPEGEQVLLKPSKTARGLLISATQPDVTGFAFAAILNDPDWHDSFLQILARAGFKLRH
jgi:hypothetical protein